MAELKQAEKMAKARESALAMLNLPASASKTGVASYLLETEFGVVEVKLTARKGEVDVASEVEEFLFDQEQKRVAAEKRKADAEAKKQANLAKKAKAKAE